MLQAAGWNANRQPSFTDPSAQFYVLTDHASLSGNQISGAKQSTDPTDDPAVQFGLTPSGQILLHDVTAVLAHRSERVNRPGQTLDQHFAIALDNQLVAVLAVDFQTYPHGTPVDTPVEISGGYRIRSAEDLAILLRFGPLPVSLRTH